MNISECWYKDRCHVDCSNSCVRFLCVKSLFEQSQLPERQWGYKKLVCDENDRQAFTTLSRIDMLDFVISGQNCYIYSANTGNGKTSWSIRLMFEYFNKIWDYSGFDCRALYMSTSKFLTDCKKSISYQVPGFEGLCKKIETVPLVIWDDLPCSTLTDYEHQLLFSYIDNRINSGLSNIYTGNCDKEETANRLGERLTSRLFSSDYVVEFVETDKRGNRNG